MELLAVCLIKQAKCRTKIILIQVSLSPSSAAICGIHLKKKKKFSLKPFRSVQIFLYLAEFGSSIQLKH